MKRALMSTYCLPSLPPGIMFNHEPIDITNSDRTIQVRLLQENLTLFDSLLRILFIYSETPKKID